MHLLEDVEKKFGDNRMGEIAQFYDEQESSTLKYNADPKLENRHEGVLEEREKYSCHGE